MWDTGLARSLPKHTGSSLVDSLCMLGQKARVHLEKEKAFVRQKIPLERFTKLLIKFSKQLEEMTGKVNSTTWIQLPVNSKVASTVALARQTKNCWSFPGMFGSS